MSPEQKRVVAVLWFMIGMPAIVAVFWRLFG